MKAVTLRLIACACFITGSLLLAVSEFVEDE